MAGARGDWSRHFFSQEERERCEPLQSSLSPFHAVQDPSPGNGPTYSGQLIPCVILVLTKLKFTARASRHSLTDRPLFRVPRCPLIKTLSVRSHCLGWYLLEGGMARIPRATYLLVSRINNEPGACPCAQGASSFSIGMLQLWQKVKPVLSSDSWCMKFR